MRVNPPPGPSQPLPEWSYGDHPVLTLLDRGDVSRSAQLVDIGFLQAEELRHLDRREVAQVLERLGTGSLRGQGEGEQARPSARLQPLERSQQLHHSAGGRLVGWTFERGDEARNLVRTGGGLGVVCWRHAATGRNRHAIGRAPEIGSLDAERPHGDRDPDVLSWQGNQPAGCGSTGTARICAAASWPGAGCAFVSFRVSIEGRPRSL